MNRTTNILTDLDARIEERNLLRHPFYQAWTRGELSPAALRDYARQYYHHVAAFPTYLSALHAHTEDQQVRRQILANLIDEEAGNPNHPELWLRFAEATGVNREEIASADLWPETRSLISTFRAACRDGSVVRGLAALYAYESQIPKVAEAKIEGLDNFYGLTDPDAIAYFRVHIEADREHSRVEHELLESRLNAEDSRDVMESTEAVLGSLWDLLSGVCQRHGIDC